MIYGTSRRTAGWLASQHIGIGRVKGSAHLIGFRGKNRIMHLPAPTAILVE